MRLLCLAKMRHLPSGVTCQGEIWKMINDTDYQKAHQIADGWRLSADERAQLLDQPDQIGQVISIHDSLHRLFSESQDQANAWIKKTNQNFGGKSALEAMLDGDIEHVRKYLKYHLYNA